MFSSVFIIAKKRSHVKDKSNFLSFFHSTPTGKLSKIERSAEWNLYFPDFGIKYYIVI